LMNSLFVLALFFFFGLCIFSPFTRVLFWEGMLLLISSLFLLLALFGLQSVDSVYFSYMDSPAAELILPFFFHELSSHLFPWNFGFIMFSFLLFIVSFILKRRNESL